MRIPFFKYDISISQRGISFVDSKTHLPVNFESWANRFAISKRTPILENIYDTIATEFSKFDLILSKDEYKTLEDGSIEHAYSKLTDNPNFKVLSLRPNVLQTKSELLYTIAYQLHMYRNALVRIVRDETADRNIVLALEPLNCDDYLFGQGYEIGDSYYLKLKEKKTGNVFLLDYGNTIHLRLNPNDIFYGDRNDKFDLTNFVKIFDENLSVLINELKNAGNVQGIVEVGGGLGGTGGFNSILSNQSDKIAKQQELTERLKEAKGGVAVLDGGEKWHSLNKTLRTMSTSEVDNMMKYLYNFKGINQAVIDGTANEAQMQIFINKSVMPLVIRLIEELNFKYLTATARAQGQKIEHFRNPFEYMSTEKMLSNLYLGAMFFTRNEVRRMGLRLPPLKGGDELMNNKNFESILGKVDKTKNGGDEDGAKNS